MIVKCKRTYDSKTKQFNEGKSSNGLRVNFLYSVLEIYYSREEIMYRVFADDSGYLGHPIIVRADEFETVSGLIPANWQLHRYDIDNSVLSPKIWNIYEPWEESFWQDYDNNLPEARKCFDRELKIIFDTDAEYIKRTDEQRLREPYFDKHIWK